MASATAIDSGDKRIVVLEISYLEDIIELDDGHITLSCVRIEEMKEEVLRR